MDSDDDDIVVAEGPLFLLWYTQDLGGHKILAQWNGHYFDLYGDEQKTMWFGEAERLDDVDQWAWDLLVEYGRLPAIASGPHRSSDGHGGSGG
ncbi:MAG: hypothetical protein [Microviridae sp.]|nr:MAG: hypothetical protein [Microviridae sp.]